MTESTSGLVAKRKTTIGKNEKKIPRLLMSMLTTLPPTPLTKREIAEKVALHLDRAKALEAAYQAMDHFELDPKQEQ